MSYARPTNNFLNLKSLNFNNMKYILLLAVSVIFFSCTKAKKIEKTIVGTWNISEFSISSKTPTFSGDTTLYNMGYLMFNKNGTGKFDAPSWCTDSFSWKNDKDNIYIVFDFDNFYKDTFKIIDFSKTKLIIESMDSVNNQSANESYKYKYNLTR
jgi:hypothetical protein